jgi:hypothetical protein
VSRDALRWALGVLWVVDGLLQLQPGMFTMAMVQSVMLPATYGSPNWVIAPLILVVHLMSGHLVLANALIAAIQLGLGLALLLGGRRARWPYICSLAWSALLWPFGQAFGGLFANGGTSVWSGAPGSALLYVLLTWAAWHTRSARSGLRARCCSPRPDSSRPRG